MKNEARKSVCVIIEYYRPSYLIPYTMARIEYISDYWLQSIDFTLTRNNINLYDKYISSLPSKWLITLTKHTIILINILLLYDNKTYILSRFENLFEQRYDANVFLSVLVWNPIKYAKKINTVGKWITRTFQSMRNLLTRIMKKSDLFFHFLNAVATFEP